MVLKGSSALSVARRFLQHFARLGVGEAKPPAHEADLRRPNGEKSQIYQESAKSLITKAGRAGPHRPHFKAISCPDSEDSGAKPDGRAQQPEQICLIVVKRRGKRSGDRRGGGRQVQITSDDQILKRIYQFTKPQKVGHQQR